MARSAAPTISFEPPAEAFLGLGSNLGNRESNLISALEGLRRGGFEVNRISSCYETSPQGGPPQNDYLNLVCRGAWSGSEVELLELCGDVELALGRVREERWGPRTIDIDILLLGRRVIVRDCLLVPHPSLQMRRFVLVPMAEIAPEVIHPVLRKTATELLIEVDRSQSVAHHPWSERSLQRLRLLGLGSPMES